jgi:hypothetical protein
MRAQAVEKFMGSAMEICDHASVGPHIGVGEAFAFGSSARMIAEGRR